MLKPSAHRVTDVGPYRVETIKNGRWRQNAYIVQHVLSGDILLVDPGGDFEIIRDRVEIMQGTPRLVLLTHAHFDHVGGLKSVCESYGLPFHMHGADARLLRRAPLFALSFDRKVISVPREFCRLGDGPLDWSSDPVNAIHTPGHTDGSVCYHIGGMCFTGDTLMKRIVGRTDLPGSSTNDLKASINTLLETIPPQTLLFPGHGGTWPVSEAKAWWAKMQDDPPEYAMDGAFI